MRLLPLAERHVFKENALVNLLFLMPSFGYGLFLFLSTGSAVLLVLSALTLLVWLVVGGQRKLDTSAPVSVRDGRIWLGDRRLNLFPWTWTTKVRDVVYPALFPKPRPQLDLSKLAPWAIGLTLEGEMLASPIAPNSPHAIICGQTGAGKTQLIRRIISGFSGDVIVLDFKGGMDFQDLTAPLRLFTGDQSELAIEVLSQRLANPGSPTLVVADELAEAVRNFKLAQVLESVASKGRSLGIHFVGATQTMTGIPRAIWSNCHSRFALRADSIDRSQLGFPLQALNHEVIGYAELFDGKTRGFIFPAEIPQPSEVSFNPLLRAVSKPWSAPGGESAPSHQTPWARQSMEERPAPQHHRDHLLGSRDQPRTWLH